MSKVSLTGLISQKDSATDNRKNSITEAIQNFKAEFDKDEVFTRRMKYLCDCYFASPDFFTDYAKTLQTIIPLEYQNYINTLGFKKIRALKYQELDIQREISIYQSLNPTSIMSLFSIGFKYSTQQIKEMLREFYEENNITKTPKASDLGEYFNLRPCQFIDKELGKKVNGFLIISLKEK